MRLCIAPYSLPKGQKRVILNPLKPRQAGLNPHQTCCQWQCKIQYDSTDPYADIDSFTTVACSAYHSVLVAAAAGTLLQEVEFSFRLNANRATASDSKPCKATTGSVAPLPILLHMLLPNLCEPTDHHSALIQMQKMTK